MLVAGSLGAVGSLATWDQASDRSDFVTESVHGDLYVSTSTSYGPGLDAEFFPSPTLEIKFMGPRNASVVLSQVEMTSQAGTFTLAIDLPYRVELDRAVVDHDGVFAEGERFGYQTVEVPFKYAPHLHETWIRTNIHLVVDGVEIEQHSFLIRKHPGLPMGAAVLAVIVPTIFLAVARIQLPRRLNRW